MIAPLPPGRVRRTNIPLYIDRSADDDTAMRARFAPFGDDANLEPADVADNAGDVCACGHDVTDHGSPGIGCIHCGNCTEFADRSTYVFTTVLTDCPACDGEGVVEVTPPRPAASPGVQADTFGPTGGFTGGPATNTTNYVPTNAELAEHAKTSTAHDVVRGWLDRHVDSGPEGPLDRSEWLDWAAQNFLADPEIAQHLRPTRADDGRTEELRLDIVEVLHRVQRERGIGMSVFGRIAIADALIAGPLAPLLAAATTGRGDDGAMQRIAALVDERTGHGGWISAQAIRRALDAET